MIITLGDPVFTTAFNTVPKWAHTFASTELHSRPGLVVQSTLKLTTAASFYILNNSSQTSHAGEKRNEQLTTNVHIVFRAH
jgi:hypothetical protein